MKRILIGLVLTAGSFSVFAKTCLTPSSLGIRVCADVIQSSEGLVISNTSPKIQVRASVTKDLCETFGDQISEYKTKTSKTKACEYFATKGFFAGGMVSACNDFGGLSRGTVYSKVKCVLKD